MHSLLCSLTWPILAVASIASYPIILLFFGEQWQDAAPIASILCFWAMLRSTYAFSATLFITTNLEKIALLKDTFICLMTLIIILSLYNSGLIAVAWGMVVCALLDLLLVIFILKYKLAFSTIKFINNNIKNTFLAVSSAGITSLLSVWLDFHTTDYYIIITVIAIINIPCWYVIVKLQENDIYLEFNNLLSSRKRNS